MKTHTTFLLNALQVYLGIFQKKKFLILSKKNTKEYLYFYIPLEVSIQKVNNSSLLLKYTDNKFSKLFSELLKRFVKPTIKQLLFKGLGLKAFFNSIKKNILKLKLGFSHFIRISIPSIIKIKIKKNKLIFNSVNLTKLGNFLFKLRLLKFPNTYKQKGIFYKQEKHTLKIFKKK